MAQAAPHRAAPAKGIAQKAQKTQKAQKAQKAKQTKPAPKAQKRKSDKSPNAKSTSAKSTSAQSPNAKSTSATPQDKRQEPQEPQKLQKPQEPQKLQKPQKPRTAVATLSLSEFRCFSQLRLDGGLVAGAQADLAAYPAVALVGANGSGKTSVLEALSLLGPGRGLRTAARERLQRRQAEASGLAATPATSGYSASGWSVVSAIHLGDKTHRLALTVGGVATAGGEATASGGVATVGGEATSRKRYLLDDEPIAAQGLARVLPLLWLTPAHVNLFSGGASLRTKFYDRLVAGFFPDQAKILNRATKLRQERRQLLAEYGGAVQGKNAAWLESLEAGLASETLAAEGRRLAVARRLLDPLAELVAPFCNLSLTLTSDGQKSEPDADALFAYAEALNNALDRTHTQGRNQGHNQGRNQGQGNNQGHNHQQALPAPETAGALVASLARQLASARPSDALTGRTRISPSHFDFVATLADTADGELLADSASTGEEKRALLSLLLAGSQALAAAGKPPLLLLDELVAHLDRQVSAALFAALDALGSQVWVSGQEVSAFPPDHFLRLALTVGTDGTRQVQVVE